MEEEDGDANRVKRALADFFPCSCALAMAITARMEMSCRELQAQRGVDEKHGYSSVRQRRRRARRSFDERETKQGANALEVDAEKTIRCRLLRVVEAAPKKGDVLRLTAPPNCRFPVISALPKS